MKRRRFSALGRYMDRVNIFSFIFSSPLVLLCISQGDQGKGLGAWRGGVQEILGSFVLKESRLSPLKESSCWREVGKIKFGS